ncbi:MAG: hypothetical protein K8R85_04625 [Bacteroidetes bacterium]|nr:hypothetical protein [Bacteroidota bacterium]
MLTRIDFLNHTLAPYHLARIESQTDLLLTKGQLVFSTHDGISINEAMRINSGGLIGIGNNAPKNLLTIGPNPLAAFNSSELLQLAKTGDAYLTIRDGVATWLMGTTGGLPFVGTQSAHDITFRTNNSEKARLTVAGNWGIGTPTPGAKLEVAGQVKITGGVPGDGKVLTSDAAGLATWEKSCIITSLTPPSCQSLAAVTAVPTQLASLGTFTKVNAATNIEITFQTFINVFDLVGTATGVKYELRVDGVVATNNAGRAVYFKDNGGISTISANDGVTMYATFPSLATGLHTITLWVSTNSGTAVSAFYDMGCWSTSNVTIKEN